MIYINIKVKGKVETLDQFETYKEAWAMLKEYCIESPFYYGAYLSSRCTKEWKGKNENITTYFENTKKSALHNV